MPVIQVFSKMEVVHVHGYVYINIYMYAYVSCSIYTVYMYISKIQSSVFLVLGRVGLVVDRLSRSYDILPSIEVTRDKL